MTSTATQQRHLRLEMMSRIEGEAGITVELQDGQLKDVKVNVFEPPRLFEAFLHGRSIDELPDIVARICGICPIAYQFTSVQAIEKALGIRVPEDIRALRQLLYYGEWIQSHALHIYFLQLPDLLGYPDALTMASDHADKVKNALRLKKIGNAVMDAVGGRSIHPINVCVGGFYKTPSISVIRDLYPELSWALEYSLETLDFVKQLSWPELQRPVNLVALSHPDEYGLLEGTLSIGETRGVTVESFDKLFSESHVEHSNALHSRRDDGSSYFVGPLARVYQNREQLSPRARAAAAQFEWPAKNPYAGVVARAIELIHCCECALRLVEDYRALNVCHVPVHAKAAEGCAATEAPRGTLYHRYRINDQGLIESARIVPPTAQNFARMEDDLRLLVPQLLDRTDEQIIHECEKLIRCYDPCVSCSVHAVRLKRS